MTFIAAVRFLNGTKGLYRISGAKDYDDARKTLNEDLQGAKTILLYRERRPCWEEVEEV